LQWPDTEAVTGTFLNFNCKEIAMNEQSQAPLDLIDLGDAKDATKGDHNPAYVEENPHILGKVS
jgi:hypothetical protein